MIVDDSCFLCGQIAGIPERDLLASMLPGRVYARRVMFETPSFAAIPSLGPVAPGHSLLCPKQHVTSFASLGGTSQAEYSECRSMLTTSLAQVYGLDIYIFEHGTARLSGRTLCSVSHAHLHFVPLPSSCSHRLLHDQEWISYDGSLSALTEITAGKEYLMFQSPDGMSRVAVGDTGAFESQHLRRLIADMVGSSWNWRTHPAPHAANETWARFVRDKQSSPTAAPD